MKRGNCVKCKFGVVIFVNRWPRPINGFPMENNDLSSMEKYLYANSVLLLRGGVCETKPLCPVSLKCGMVFAAEGGFCSLQIWLPFLEPLKLGEGFLGCRNLLALPAKGRMHTTDILVTFLSPIMYQFQQTCRECPIHSNWIATEQHQFKAVAWIPTHCTLMLFSSSDLLATLSWNNKFIE